MEIHRTHTTYVSYTHLELRQRHGALEQVLQHLLTVHALLLLIAYMCIYVYSVYVYARQRGEG